MRLQECLIITYPFSLHKAFATSRAQQLSNSIWSHILILQTHYSLLYWLRQELILCSKIILELASLHLPWLLATSMNERLSRLLKMTWNHLHLYFFTYIHFLSFNNRWLDILLSIWGYCRSLITKGNCHLNFYHIGVLETLE